MSDYEDEVDFNHVGSDSTTLLPSNAVSEISYTSQTDDSLSISDPNRDLVIELLQAEHDDMVGRQKGKEKAGHMSDFQLALRIWNEEIESTKQRLNDTNIALSISNAIVADQNIIASIQEEESQATRDRELALRLGGNARESRQSGKDATAIGPPAVASKREADADAEMISKVISDLERLVITKKPASTASAQASSSGTRRQCELECVVCTQTLSTAPLYEPPCQHLYCNDCFRHLFLSATSDEGLFPPRCCGNILPPNLAMRLLTYPELLAFCKAGVEFSTKDRLYCADPKCSTFIQPGVIKGEMGKCPECDKTTHTVCKALIGPDHECPSDEALQSVLSIAKKSGWQRCPECRTMVELLHGCNHMTCRCGKQFCYVCLTTWKNCKCDVWHEANLYHVALRAAHNEMERQTDAAGRAEVLERVVQGLRDHEQAGCQHHLRFNWRYTTDRNEFQCEMCHAKLPDFIFECRSCLMTACKRCMRNRVR